MHEREVTALVVMPPGQECSLVTRALGGLGARVKLAAEPYEGTRRFLDAFDDDLPITLVVLSMVDLGPRDHSFLTQLRRLAPDLRVLLLVPQGRREDAVGFLRAGADAMLPRPFLVDEFTLIVGALLREDATDPLTSLPNRSAYLASAVRELARADRDGTSIGLGLLDVDDFGRANHELGYKLADGILIEVAQRIRKNARIMDVGARWGGEEFVVLLTGLSSAEATARAQGREVLERIRRAVADTPFAVEATTERRVTLCGGLGLFPHEVSMGPGSAESRTRREYLAAERALFDVANRRLKRGKGTDGKDTIVGDDED